MGKEGPMVHTGACIANLLGQGGSRKYHLTWTWLRYFKNDRDRRDMITCGAAAGVAAAFRAPVGGVLFALEEAASWYPSLSLLMYIFLFCFFVSFLHKRFFSTFFNCQYIAIRLLVVSQLSILGEVLLTFSVGRMTTI